MYGFATAPSGHALMTGAFSGTAALEGGAAASSGTFTSAGLRDVFLASF